jgi:hypothetical protein
VIDTTMRLRGSEDILCAAFGFAFSSTSLAWYQRPTENRISIARSATAENQAMLPCPNGTTMKAASSGPKAVPALPPTWNTDCASPCRPPDAMRATREDSGWKTEDPIPTRAAPRSSIG